MDNHELYNILTATLWQDFKGYQRNLESRPYICELLVCLWNLIWVIIFSPLLFLILLDNGDFRSSFLRGVNHTYKYLVKYPSVRRLCYDIELTTNTAKVFRTKRKKYGIIFENEHPFLDNKVFPCILLSPKYNIITREDDSSYIISKKHRFGIYNSELKKIVVPVKYDIIYRPDKSRNLFVAKLKGVEALFNSWGDRIIRD